MPAQSLSLNLVVDTNEQQTEHDRSPPAFNTDTAKTNTKKKTHPPPADGVGDEAVVEAIRRRTSTRRTGGAAMSPGVAAVAVDAMIWFCKQKNRSGRPFSFASSRRLPREVTRREIGCKCQRCRSPPWHDTGLGDRGAEVVGLWSSTALRSELCFLFFFFCLPRQSIIFVYSHENF